MWGDANEWRTTENLKWINWRSCEINVDFLVESWRGQAVEQWSK